jgi:hypothetical protein
MDKEGRMTFFKVSEAWVEESVAPTQKLTIFLDFEGTDDGSSLPIKATGAVFALIAALMARGCPIYFSGDGNAISTEPTFGNQTYSPPEDSKWRPILHTDAVWRISDDSGTLTMILDNRSRMKIELDDAGQLAGWLLTAATHVVESDGSGLRSRREPAML